MAEQFDNEKFASTLNILGIHQSMVEQMLNQEYHTLPRCPYFGIIAWKLMDLKVALIAMNTIYATAYEQYKEQNPNG